MRGWSPFGKIVGGVCRGADSKPAAEGFGTSTAPREQKPERISGRHDERSVNVSPVRFLLAIRCFLADNTGRSRRDGGKTLRVDGHFAFNAAINAAPKRIRNQYAKVQHALRGDGWNRVRDCRLRYRARWRAGFGPAHPDWAA
jgi:hypothetical protein